MPPTKTALFFLLFCTLLGSTCTRPGDAPEDDPAFYFWKTKLEFSPADTLVAKEMGVKKLYLRCFDVDWSEGYRMAIPQGELNVENLKHYPFDETVPTVYITNATLKQLNPKTATELAEKITRKILSYQEYLSTLHFRDFHEKFPDSIEYDVIRVLRDTATAQWGRQQFKEIQLDCDWTASTRQLYFFFLKEMKRINPQTLISCTLRLHQYRDRSVMGIPPVERVSLMCYNTGDVKDPKESNAILDLKVLENYLKKKTYPLSMDLALPLFNWGAWYRDREFMGILGDWSKGKADQLAYLKAEPQNRYRVMQDTVIGLDYLRYGDWVRIDGPDPAQLKAAQAFVQKQVGKQIRQVIYFDWNIEKMKAYEEVIEGWR
jgi:hypothetical protein